VDAVQRAGPDALGDRGAAQAELAGGHDSVLARGELGQLRVEGKARLGGCFTFRNQWLPFVKHP
jgi:hypothetical protein